MIDSGVSPPAGLHSIARGDLAAATGVLTEAFDEDPCLRYLLCDGSYDPRKARRIHRYTLRLGRRYGLALATGPGLEAVCAWLPPSRAHVSTGMSVAAGVLAVTASGLDVMDALRRYGDYSGGMHRRAVVGPHWYLLTLAVSKASQGKGYATKLLSPMLAGFDARGESAYLETHNPRNVPLYERFGFEVVATGALPGTETTHYSMLRPPRA